MGTEKLQRPEDWMTRDDEDQPEDGDHYLMAVETHDIKTRLNFWRYEQVQACKSDHGWKFYYSSGHLASFRWEDVGFYMPLLDQYA